MKTNILYFVIAAAICVFATTNSFSQEKIAGYTYGQSSLQRSPVSLDDFEKLKQTVLFTDEDIKYLRMSGDVLKDQTDDVLDVWYGFVGSTPQLAYFFTNKKDGKLDADYLSAVRKRFAKWILDTSNAKFDQQWLDYQYEIALRHTKLKKNKTDKVTGVSQVNFRYIPALVYPITATLKPFLAKKGNSPEVAEKMYQAWVKIVLLQAILWSQPYIKDGQF
jgi:Protoglobin